MISWGYIYTFIVIFGAGIIRGYSGFGFAILSVITLSFVYPPAVITPLILCLEIIASIWLFSKVRKFVEWQSLRVLLTCSAITIPLGSYALTSIPVTPLRVFIALTVLLLCFGLLRKKQASRITGTLPTMGIGMVAGFLTGIAAIGGPPVILFYLSSHRSVSVSRASMIAFFLVVDCLALLSCLWYGLLDRQVLILSTSMVIPLAIGIWMGNFLFKKNANEEKFRRQSLIVLMVTAAISLVHATVF